MSHMLKLDPVLCLTGGEYEWAIRNAVTKKLVAAKTDTDLDELLGWD